MQVIGKICNFGSTPVFLGHRPSDPHHINVLCDEEGNVYDEAYYLKTGLGIPYEQIGFLFESNAGTIAKLLKKPVELVGLNLNDSGTPLIVDFSQ